MFNLCCQCSIPKLWDPPATIRRYHVWCLPTLLIFHKFLVPSNIFSYIHSTYEPIKLVVNQQFEQPLSSFIYLRPSNSQSSPMFSTIAILIATFFAASAVASPGIKNSCNTGPIQCCGNLYASNSAAATKAIGLLNVVIPNITGDIGAQCDPITVIGAGKGASWSVYGIFMYVHVH